MAPERSAMLALVTQILDDGKAEDIRQYNMMGRSPLADYTVVASGRSQRHVGALAEQLEKKLREVGYSAHIEGLPACDWVLVDALDIIVHLFRPEVRAFYNLEQMWSDDASMAEAG
ncbi:MAG TPA: ribosome silencing factor [Alphaproteobacteria bacterium]|nr:ribosome silencing factor [Alphaproteobacteria bacterium]